MAHGPYQPVVKANDILFISGQIGIDSETKLTGKGIKEQANIAFSNIKKLLNEHKEYCLVKTTIFLVNMDDFDLVNSIYTEHFQPPMPARSCVEVSDLPHVGSEPLVIEVEAVAAKEVTNG